MPSEPNMSCSHDIAHALLDSLPVGFFTLDSGWRFTYVNTQAEAVWQRTRQELLGQNIWEMFPEAIGSSFHQQYTTALEENRTITFEEYYPPHATWVEVQASPNAGGLSVFFRDVTQRVLTEQKFRVLFEHSSDAHLLFDENGIMDCNQAAIAMLHCQDKAQVLSLHPAALSPEVQPDGRLSLEKCLEMDAIARQKGFHRFEWIHRKMDGEDFPVEVTLTPVSLHNKAVLLVVWHDLTERKQAENALRDSQHFIARIAEASPNILYVHDLETHHNVYANREIAASLGYGAVEIQRLGSEVLPQLLHPEDFTGVMEHLHKMEQASDGEIWETEYRMRRADGGWCWFHSRDTVFSRGSDGSVRQVLGTAQDVTSQKQYEQQIEAQMCRVNEANVILEQQKQTLAEVNARLEALATTDGLTGLKNHRTFQERLAEEFERGAQAEGALSLLMLDVDKFKQYNDAFGHPAGDQVLKQVARILREKVGLDDFPARYGGEEFVIILPRTDAFRARVVAERLREAIETCVWPNRAVTVSVGIATLCAEAATLGAEMADPSTLIAQADRALYRSKQRGRNRVTHALELSDELMTDGRDVSYPDIIQMLIEAQKDTLVSVKETIKEAIYESYDATAQSWSRLLDLRDKETEGHSERVTAMAVQLAHRVGMHEEEVRYVRWGALLHDIGKMGVPDHILLKPGPLTDEEWIVMRRHPDIAYEMLSSISFLRPALDIPHCHHEKWDGSGYPQGLQGEDIPLAARLFAVIDVYDALRSDRPYRSGWPEERVLEHLQEQAGTHFDARAVKAFIGMIRERNRDAGCKVYPDTGVSLRQAA